jgi:ankyrin repeat protein
MRATHGRTPLHVATFARQRGAIRALVKAGADINLLENDRYDAVTIAAVADDEETLRVLLSLGASAKQVTSRYDGTALIAAAHLGHDGVVRQLIAAGAPLDHVNNLHWTAVIEAIVLGDGGPRHQATLKALLDAGASLVADHAGVHPHAAAVDQAVALATWSGQVGHLEQRANAHGGTALGQGQAISADVVGHTALAAVDEILLGRIGGSRAVEAGGDFLGQRHLGVFGVAARLHLGLECGNCLPRLEAQAGCTSATSVRRKCSAPWRTWCWGLR